MPTTKQLRGKKKKESYSNTYKEGEGLLELGDLLFSKCLSLKSDRDMLAQKKKKTS